jgi:hypothetical protein
VSPNATQLFTLTVTAPPAFTSASSDTVAAGTAFTYSVTTTGTPTPSISLASGSKLPAGVTLTNDGNGTATLAGTSSVAAGAYMFSLQAANGIIPNATQIFALTVTKSQPTTLTTVLSGSGKFGGGRCWWLGDFITVFSGASVTDSATLSGANAASAGGTVTYTVYPYDFWSIWGFGHKDSVASGGTVTVTKGTVPNSNPVVLPPGLYVWEASYSGDALNAPSTSQWDSEIEYVVPVPSCKHGWSFGLNGGCRSNGHGHSHWW